MELRRILATVFGIFFLYTGALHFTDTDWFEPIVPSILGSPKFWILASGVAEILLGIGLILPQTKEISGYAAAAFLVLIYPANLYMWIYDIELGDGASLSPTGHIVRLFVQIAMIGLGLWIGGWNPNQSSVESRGSV